jgi:hypothetical protein
MRPRPHGRTHVVANCFPDGGTSAAQAQWPVLRCCYEATISVRLLAANGDLVGLAGRRLVLVYHEVHQSRVVIAYFVHIDVVSRAGDRERAGEQECRQA